MKIVLKNNRTLGRYYQVTTTLTVKNKPVTISTDVRNLNEYSPYFELSCSEMSKILEITQPSDWLFKTVEHSYDDYAWEYSQKDYTSATQENINTVLHFLKQQTEQISVIYVASTDDSIFGIPPLESGTFHVSTEFNHYALKPAKNFVVFGKLPKRTKRVQHDLWAIQRRDQNDFG